LNNPRAEAWAGVLSARFKGFWLCPVVYKDYNSTVNKETGLVMGSPKNPNVGPSLFGRNHE